ncbi:MAG: hypothetical protein ACRCVT_00340 [Leadbetterella sp.]
MNKVFGLLIVAASLSFASCNKAQEATEAVDSTVTAVDTAVAPMDTTAVDTTAVDTAATK